MIKRMLQFVSTLLLLISLAAAQGTRKDDTVTRGYGGATITVCANDHTKALCIVPIQLYDNLALTTLKPEGNPFLTDAEGNFHFYVLPGMYKLQISAGFLTHPLVIPDYVVSSATGGGGGGSGDATSIQGTLVDTTPPVPPSVFVANIVGGAPLAQWANGTVGQAFTIAYPSTPAAPPVVAYNNRSGWTVACSTEQGAPNHFSPPASSSYYSCQHMIEEPPQATAGNWISLWDCSAVPGPGDPETLCPNQLPATVTVNLGSTQPIGTIGYLAGINNNPNTSATAASFETTTDAACASGWSTVLTTSWTPTTGIVALPLAGIVSGHCVRMTITAMSSVPAGSFSCNTSSAHCSAAGSGIFIWPTIQASAFPLAQATVKSKIRD